MTAGAGAERAGTAATGTDHVRTFPADAGRAGTTGTGEQAGTSRLGAERAESGSDAEHARASTMGTRHSDTAETGGNARNADTGAARAGASTGAGHTRKSSASAERAEVRGAGAGFVVLDGMGGDHGPAEAVAGAVLAYRVHGVPVLLTGRERELAPLLRRHDAVGEIPVVHAPDAVPMSERGPGASPASSLAVGCELVRRGAGAALVSAGSTGAVVSRAMGSLGRAGGVSRPALAVALPQRGGGVSVLLDAGATADPTPAMIGRFAMLGVAYARTVLGVAEPVAGLLSIGTEPGKGNRLTRRAARVLAETPVRFHGMVEGHDVLAGTVDVIVTDGFTGNVVLKSIEGCVRTTLGMVAAAGLAAPPALAEVGAAYDPRTHGGAALLGLRGTVVVAHGSSDAETIARACVVAHALASPAAGRGAVAGASAAGPVRGNGV